MKKIAYLHKQEVIDITSDGKGIRLDVYLEDNENTVYDIEIQAAEEAGMDVQTFIESMSQQ